MDWQILGEMRRLTILPKSPDSDQHVRSLFRIRRTNEAFSVVHAWEERADSYAIVGEWVEGIDLKGYLARTTHRGQPAISPHQVIRLVKGLAHGLDWLHHAGRIVHADIKPQNLIVNRSAHRLVLVDYGSAWPVERTARRELGDGFHAGYAAPELQGAAGVIDGRADQFSASVVLYEMLTGQLPYQWGGKAGRPEFVASMQKTYRPPSQLSPDRARLPTRVWQAIDSVVATGVAFDPDRRYWKRRISMLASRRTSPTLASSTTR